MAKTETRAASSCPSLREQLADALGLTSVHVNRTMQQLRTEGLIVRESRAITISDVARLRDAGKFNPAYLHIHPTDGERRDLSPDWPL